MKEAPDKAAETTTKWHDGIIMHVKKVLAILPSSSKESDNRSSKSSVFPWADTRLIGSGIKITEVDFASIRTASEWEWITIKAKTSLSNVTQTSWENHTEWVHLEIKKWSKISNISNEVFKTWNKKKISPAMWESYFVDEEINYIHFQIDGVSYRVKSEDFESLFKKIFPNKGSILWIVWSPFWEKWKEWR